MTTRRLIHVQDSDPLSTTRQVLQSVWKTANLESLYLPIWEENELVPSPQWIEDTDDLIDADPFAPFMLQNSAGEVAAVLFESSSQKYGVFLRPCEIQSLHHLAAVNTFDLSPFMLMSSDCLSVFPEEYFIERSSQAAHHEEATLEMLHFASQGGILPSRYQLACQICEHPFPIDVHLHFEIIGIPTSQYLIIESEIDELVDALDDHLKTDRVPKSVELRREETLSRLENWRGKSLWTTSASLDKNDVGLVPLLEHLKGCKTCRHTLEEFCPVFEPIWEPDDPDLDQLVEGWVRSCGGCGMCDHDCPDDYPLFKVVVSIRAELQSKTQSQ